MSRVFGHGRLRLYLLRLLDERPRHGYDVIRELEDRFLGTYSPSAGTVYPRLARLEADGLVEHEVVEGRKVYRITGPGRSELAARAGELDDLDETIAGSVRALAAEIRSEVRGSVATLQAELRAAAKEVRRQHRHAARDAGRTDRAAEPQHLELDASIEWLGAELRAATRGRALTADDVAEVRTLLQRVLDDVRRRVEAG